MEKKPIPSVNPIDDYDWIPMILKSTSGFNSCLTVAITTLIFVVTMHDAIMYTKIGWFTPTQIFLMTCGVVIMAWHFVNANTMLSSVLRVEQEPEVEEVVEDETTRACDDLKCTTKHIKQHSKIITEEDVAIERRLFGLSTVLMRAVAGCVSVHVICFGSLIFTWSIREAILLDKLMPGDIEIFLAVIGPIITSWHFVRAANTLNVLVKSGGIIIKLRTWLAEALAVKPK
ncbi:hypothetical protein [Aeromonas phage ZPAH34]|uniref:hypothetical protein n=1 Tax=Aeromonas phage ZPAH34 TaxID=2924888 RepID=UPI00232906AC|nr:hypothetical protein PQD16_gp104 [Aeromonas phage ZPAH34]UOX39579.1 hypothetical protein [Aeromonas phage ZPAH34]